MKNYITGIELANVKVTYCHIGIWLTYVYNTHNLKIY